MSNPSEDDAGSSSFVVEVPTASSTTTPDIENDNHEDIYPEPNEKDLDTEFIYYSMLLKTLVPCITNEKDRDSVKKWVERLFGPEYQSCLFNEKRNKYLLHIVLCLLNDNLSDILKHNPPEGALPPLEDMSMCTSPPAEWEEDGLWDAIVQDMDGSLCPMKCGIHKNCSHRETTVADCLLDSEFRLLLYTAKAYVSLLNTEDKLLAASWLQTLCSITQHCCPGMKGIRNDYMQALTGYLQDLRVTGPFQDYPLHTEPLCPFKEAVEMSARKYSFTNPASADANNFLKTQPMLRNGAICFMAVNGELMENNAMHSTSNEK